MIKHAIRKAVGTFLENLSGRAAKDAKQRMLGAARERGRSSSALRRVATDPDFGEAIKALEDLKGARDVAALKKKRVGFFQRDPVKRMTKEIDRRERALAKYQKRQIDPARKKLDEATAALEQSKATFKDAVGARRLARGVTGGVTGVGGLYAYSRLKQPKMGLTREESGY